jgi:5-methyltetrahydropteroyltriglutamate--homocysteine methyltransferase
LSRGRAAYASKEELGEDLVQILRDEVLTLRDAGVGFLPLDEPVLTELVFTSGQTRTFMCATVASRADPAEELEFAAGLMNRVVDGLEGVRTGVHICRGNRSRQERLLLSGSYPPLAPYPARLNVDQLVLEFATPRAGELGALLGCEPIRQNNELGLGVTNPRTEDVDLVESITAGVDECLQWLRTGQIFLNPDCGSGTFFESAGEQQRDNRQETPRDGGRSSRAYANATARRAEPTGAIGAGHRTRLAASETRAG